MKIGVVFPQTEIGADVATVKRFAQRVEAMGFSHLLAYDHVLGASIANRPNFSGPYTSDSMFHEIMVLFGYLAGVTKSLELVSGVLIAPQRQTALIAKQAAEIDVLNEGRLRLGIGVGWNDVEFVGLNESFSNRGKRSEEQIEVMRALWTKPIVDLKTKWHEIPEAGLNPLPIQRPIPIWIGGYVDATMERIGRMADGWFPGCQPGDKLQSCLDKIAAAAQANGRDAARIGMEGRININKVAAQHWPSSVDSWAQAGATHLSLVTMDGQLSPDQQLDKLEAFARSVDL